ALASPTFGELNQTQAGAVSLYRLHELSGELLDTDVVPVVTLLGSEDYARFGGQLLMADFNGDLKDELLVAAPNRRGAAGAEAGEVFMWQGGALPVGNTRQAEETALVSVEGATAAERLGSTLLSLDLTGDGVAELVIGSRQDGTLAPVSGKVSVYQNPLSLTRSADARMLKRSPAAATGTRGNVHSTRRP
ncbi:MAG: FG-GAP repeat protein, partial [Myxococcota bacterium]